MAEQHGTLKPAAATDHTRPLVRLRAVAVLFGVLTMLVSAAEAQSPAWKVLLGGDDANTPRMPSGVAVDDQGTIYVVDTGGSRIEKLSPAGQVELTIGRLGPDEAGLRRPRGIALDRSGALYVADTANHRIQRFSALGDPLGAWGTIGSGPGEFILPTSLAFDSSGDLYVADTGNHRVQKLGPDGRFLGEWSGVHFPHGIAIDALDNVYVSDEAGVRKFSASGELLADWTAAGQFGDPYGLTVDVNGTLYVADTDTGRILAISPTGELQASWGSQGAGVGQLKYPEAVAVDGQGAIYVADRGNDRLQVVRP
jgi:DNA-binding beta-propeller fold protein YncE